MICLGLILNDEDRCLGGTPCWRCGLMDRKASYPGPDDAIPVAKTHSDGNFRRSGRQNDLAQMRQTAIQENAHVAAKSEWGHAAGLTALEPAGDFRFRRQAQLRLA